MQNPLAYSYIRFSTPEQAKGDSLRRQIELRDKWLKEQGVILDTTLTLRDEGVSGYTGEHRENPDRHGLACFLEAVRSGRVKRGSYLIVENLDRLSREDVVPAVNLLTGILVAGIRVVQLTPHAEVYDAKADMMDLLKAIMELSRGNGESKRKSGLNSEAWQQKRRLAADGLPQQGRDKSPVCGMSLLSHRLPGWIVESGGKPVLHPGHSQTVERIYRLALDGNGVERIAKILNRDAVPTFTARAATWSISTLYLILTSKAVIGEHQPHTASGTGGKRVAAGHPIPNYFPPAIPEDLFWRVQQARKSRFQGGGRTGKHINLFQGLLVDARDGGTFVMMNAKQRPSIIYTLNAKQGVAGAVWSAFPLVEFEQAILSCLAEIDPADILPQAVENKTLSIAGELASVEARLTKLKSLLRETDEVEELVHTVRDLAAKRQELIDQLQVEKGAEAAPLADAWARLRELVNPKQPSEHRKKRKGQQLEDSPTSSEPAPHLIAKWQAIMTEKGEGDEARIRLKAGIARVVENITLLVLPAVKGQDRLAFARLQFKGVDRHRDYAILVRTPKANASTRTEGAYSVQSFAASSQRGELDLRKKADVIRLEKVLAKIVE